MRTTVRLDEGLLKRAKAAARQRGTTLTSLIERGLMLVLAAPEGAPRRRRVTLPVFRASGGLQPDVSLDDTSALLDRLDGIR